MNEPKPLPSETKLVETPRSDEVWEKVWADEFNESLSDTLYDFARQLERELASLADELRQAREDARRYRWLREAHLPPTTVLTVVTNQGYGLWAKALDNAIDAALKDAASSGPKEVDRD